MKRTRKGARGSSPSQDVKDAKQTAQEHRKHARELLKKAGKNVREVRHEVSQLKKAGLVAKHLDVRKYQPTRYMLRKLKENADILSGKAVAVRAPKSIRKKYVEKGIFEQRGGSLIVPREYQNQKTRIARGMVEISRELRMGEERRLILPFKATDMENLANKLAANPDLDKMKRPDELFGFRLFGHNMNTIGFPSAEELAEYILTRYSHLFSGKNGREGVKHFELLRFRSKNSQMQHLPESERVFTPRRRDTRRPEKDFIIKKRLERDRLRKAKQRERETPEQRKKRLDAQRIRQAQYRQRKFLGE